MTTVALTEPDLLPRFRALYPELTATDVQVQAAFQIAVRLHAARREAFFALTAHLLVLLQDDTPQPNQDAGEVQQETLGPKTVRYVTMATGPGRETFFARSVYGRLFLLLEARSPRRVLSVDVM